MNLSFQDLAEIAIQFHEVDGGHCVTPKYYEGEKLSYKSRIEFLDYHFPNAVRIMRHGRYATSFIRIIHFLN